MQSCASLLSIQRDTDIIRLGFAIAEMCSLAQETPLPTTLVLEHHDSYTRNILSLFSEIAGSSRRAPREASKEGAEEWIVWQHEGWRERIVIVNVDTITW